MGLFDKVGSFFRREAKDFGDAAEVVKDKLDHELSKREHQLEMTPAEKVTALQQQASANDERFDQIAEKAAGRRALADAVAEVGELANDASLPNISHIVLPDGRVRSGNDVNQVVDASAPAHDVPVIEVPTTDDLGQEQPPHPTASLPDAAAAPDVPDTPDSPESPDTPAVDDLGQDLPAPPTSTPAAAAESAVEATEAVPQQLDPSNPAFGKTPAQLKYELARAAANELLDELRGELKDDGEI